MALCNKGLFLLLASVLVLSLAQFSFASYSPYSDEEPEAGYKKVKGYGRGNKFHKKKYTSSYYDDHHSDDDDDDDVPYYKPVQKKPSYKKPRKYSVDEDDVVKPVYKKYPYGKPTTYKPKPSYKPKPIYKPKSKPSYIPKPTTYKPKPKPSYVPKPSYYKPKPSYIPKPSYVRKPKSKPAYYVKPEPEYAEPEDTDAGYEPSKPTPAPEQVDEYPYERPVYEKKRPESPEYNREQPEEPEYEKKKPEYPAYEPEYEKKKPEPTPSTPAASSSAGEWLEPHNAARAQVGVPPLVWSDELAAYAQNWANQRKAAGCGLQHSSGPYGENIFWGSGSGYGPAECVAAWVNERQFYSYGDNSCSNGDCGHYTQIVWANTARLGCAKAECSDGSVFLTCNYDPPGNYVGAKPY